MVAPLRHACKEAGGPVRQILWFGPMATFEQTGPAGTSGRCRALEIRYEALDASVDYLHAGMARGSQCAVAQALQPIPLQRTPGPICDQGARGYLPPYLSAQASANKP